MNIEIRKLTPDLAEDYLTFFDTTPHNEKYNIKCYCVWWCSDDSEGKSFATKKARRDYAVDCIKGNHIQGYLAYCDDKVVGWCNANMKSDCLRCKGWRGMNGPRKGYLPTEESTPEIKVKSVFCFVVAQKCNGKASLRNFWRVFVKTRPMTVLITWKPTRIKMSLPNPKTLWDTSICIKKLDLPCFLKRKRNL